MEPFIPKKQRAQNYRSPNQIVAKSLRHILIARPTQKRDVGLALGGLATNERSEYLCNPTTSICVGGRSQDSRFHSGLAIGSESQVLARGRGGASVTATATARHGVSSIQVLRMLEVVPRPAHRVTQRVRVLVADICR